VEGWSYASGSSAAKAVGERDQTLGVGQMGSLVSSDTGSVTFANARQPHDVPDGSSEEPVKCS
jgi:hypothetical protein